MVHGEISSPPARGCESVGGAGIDGIGRKKCAASWRIRFPPAESPLMMIFDGGMPKFSRCVIATVAWPTWVGKGLSGTIAFGRGISICIGCCGTMATRKELLTMLHKGNAKIAEGGRPSFLKGE